VSQNPATGNLLIYCASKDAILLVSVISPNAQILEILSPSNSAVNFFTRATLASAGISCRRVSVCPSVCHNSVFYRNG